MKNRKILVCDDDQGIVDMLEMMLELENYEVIGETNSLEVFRLIEKEQPALLVVDLWMPIVSGDQVVKQLRTKSETKSLKIAMISASRDGREIAMDAGADLFIGKPFDMVDFLTQVGELMRSGS